MDDIYSVTSSTSINWIDGLRQCKGFKILDYLCNNDVFFYTFFLGSILSKLCNYLFPYKLIFLRSFIVGSIRYVPLKTLEVFILDLRHCFLLYIYILNCTIVLQPT